MYCAKIPLLSTFLVLTCVVSGTYAAPIHDAAYAGDLARLGDLLSAHPEELEAVDLNGCTPLDAAILGGKTATANELLKAGANVNVADKDGMTPLMISVYKAKPLCTLLLLNHGANVNAVDKHHRSALTMAAFEDNYARGWPS